MFTITVPIQTSSIDERYFEKCFFLAWKAKNLLVKHAISIMGALNCDRAYRNARQEYGRKFAGKDKKTLNREDSRKRNELISVMIEKQKKYHFTENDFEKYLAVQQHKCKGYISSHQMQSVADNVWSSVEDVLFKKGKTIHLSRLEEFLTIPQKDDNGLKLKDRYHVVYQKKIFRLKTPDTEYINYAFEHGGKIRYCYLKRMAFDNGWKYYVSIVFAGSPLHREKADDGVRKGVDVGTSTIAAVSSRTAMLENLAPDSARYEKQIRHLQALLDHKTRLANPDNYDETGKPKKGRRKWTITRAAKRLKWQIRTLYRKESQYIRTSHGQQLNRILDDASEVIIEPISIRSMQKKAKKTERSEKETIINGKPVHKYRRKKRYGHSIHNHSPGLLMKELKRKAELMDIPYFEIHTAKYRASQFRHDTGEYIRSPVSERYKVVDGQKVQRDLYSAFLIEHTDDTLEKPDVEACNKDFPQFVELMNCTLNEMKANGLTNKACWGF